MNPLDTEVQQSAEIFDQRPIDVDENTPEYLQAGHRFKELYRSDRQELWDAIHQLEGSRFRCMFARLFEMDRNAAYQRRTEHPAGVRRRTNQIVFRKDKDGKSYKQYPEVS